MWLGPFVRSIGKGRFAQLFRLISAVTKAGFLSVLGCLNRVIEAAKPRN